MYVKIFETDKQQKAVTAQKLDPHLIQQHDGKKDQVTLSNIEYVNMMYQTNMQNIKLNQEQQIQYIQKDVIMPT